MKALSFLLALFFFTPAFAQMSGLSTEVCYTPTVTNGAYSAGYLVGSGPTNTALPFALATGPSNSAVLQNVSIQFKDAQTSEFDVTCFRGNPSNTTWTEHQAPAIAAADAFKALPTIKLTNYASVLGTNMTVYGQDSIGRVINLTASTLYCVVTTTGTPTLGSTSDMQVCVGVLRDN